MTLGQGLGGGTNTPQQTTEYWDSVLTTSMAAVRETLIDNIFKDSAYLVNIRI